MKRTAPTLPFVLAAVLAGGAGEVAADRGEASVSAPRARLVEVFARVGQALLYDKNRDEYVVVKRGDRFRGLVVSAIESDQIVLSTRGPSRSHYVLPLAPEHRPAAPAGEKRAGRSRGAPLRILDPYVGSDEDLDVVDPYGGDRSIPSVTAPPESRAGATPTPTPAPKTKPEPEPEPEPVSTSGAGPEKAGATSAAREERRTIQRAELDKALADFQTLQKEVEIERTDSGRIRITGLARGSFLHRLGLREGDVVRSVAGRRIDNADRAAAVYVELTVTERFDVQLERGGSPLTIHYRVK